MGRESCCFAAIRSGGGCGCLFLKHVVTVSVCMFFWKQSGKMMFIDFCGFGEVN